MIVVDTNVVSEAMRARPNKAVAAWFDAQPRNLLFLCTPVLAELRFGIERLADGRQKESLLVAVERFENELYRGRILTFDQAAAIQFARLSVVRERQDRRMAQMDALIAAIAASHGATLATRDIGDFDGIGLDLINPFDVR